MEKNILKKENEKEKIEGIFSEKDFISPSYIDVTNPKYIEMDNLYFSSLLITNYYHEQTDLLLKSIIDSNVNMYVSIFYEKQDSYKVVKDLTYHIGNVGVDLKSTNENREDN